MFSLRLIRLLKRQFGSFLRHNTCAKFRNLCCILYQQWQGTTDVKGYPFEIVVDPTNICTLRCPLCVTGQKLNTRPLGRMALEDYKSIVDELAQWLYKIRYYSWGEPLLHPDICKMITYANERNIGTELSSNLQQFSKDGPEGLVRSGLELLIASVDGATQATYSTYRVGGKLETVLGNLQALVRTRQAMKKRLPRIELQFLVMKHNQQDMEEMRVLAKQHGVDRIAFAPLVINTKDPEQVHNWLPDNEKYSRYEYASLQDRIFRARRRCPWLWRSAVINWDASVSPCCVFEGPKTDFGNLRDQKFADLWNGESYQAARRVFSGRAGGAMEQPTICTRCKGYPEAYDDRQKGLY